MNTLVKTLIEQQIEDYSNRLAKAVSIEERAWLREQLHNFKTPNRYTDGEIYANNHHVDNPVDHLRSDVGTQVRTKKAFQIRYKKIKCL